VTPVRRKRRTGDSGQGWPRADTSSVAGANAWRFHTVSFTDREDGELFIGGETVVGAGRDERQASFPKLQLLAVDVEHAASLEDDVELILCVQQPMVGLRRDERIHQDLKPCRLVDDLVSTVAGAEAGFGPGDVESVSLFSEDRRERLMELVEGWHGGVVALISSHSRSMSGARAFSWLPWLRAPRR
jgi:hypothetical protein